MIRDDSSESSAAHIRTRECGAFALELQASVDIERVGRFSAGSWRLRLEGIAFSAHHVRARYVEAEARLAAEVFPGFTPSLGYRRIWTYFQAREESLNFDLDGAIGGPYLALGYRF